MKPVNIEDANACGRSHVWRCSLNKWQRTPVVRSRFVECIQPRKIVIGELDGRRCKRHETFAQTTHIALTAVSTKCTPRAATERKVFGRTDGYIFHDLVRVCSARNDDDSSSQSPAQNNCHRTDFQTFGDGSHHRGTLDGHLQRTIETGKIFAEPSTECMGGPRKCLQSFRCRILLVPGQFAQHSCVESAKRSVGAAPAG